MQSTAISVNSTADCFLQVRHRKTTIFTDVTETTTVVQLKQILGNILQIDPQAIRVTCKGQIFDNDNKRLIEYGVTSKQARPQNPLQLEYSLRIADGSYESDEIIPYLTENSLLTDEQQQRSSSLSMDTRS